MGLLKNIVSKGLVEQGANYSLGHSIASSGVSNIFGTGGSEINLLQEYSGFVWKCVNVRSENLAANTLFIERMVADKWQRDNAHVFNDVLEGQDGGYDQSELVEGHQVCMDMYGEAFWYFSKGETSNLPFGIYLLDPAYVSVFVSGERVTGYVYDKDGDRITMELDEVAHFRIHNPANRFRGAGPMQKAGWFIRGNRYVTTYINNFLENNAIPAGVIVGDPSVNDDDWKLFKEAWINKYSGINNAGKTGFVRGNLKFEKTGLSLGDVDFEKVKNSTRDDILAMFSMPKSKLGLYEDMNKASAVVSNQEFAETFTEPAVRRLTRRLSRKVSKWYGPQYRVGTDFEVPEDREIKLKEYASGTNVWITRNEAREAYGLERLQGEEFDTIQSEKVADVPAENKSLGKVTLRTKSGKKEFSYEMKESFRSEAEDIQRKYEKKFLEASNKVLTDQKERVLDQLQPKKIADAHLDAQDEATLLFEATISLELGLALEQGNLAAAFAGSADTTFQLTPAVEKYVRDSLAASTKSFTDDTIDKIAQIMVDGVNAGDSMPKIAKSISKLYEDVTGVKSPGYRIERLARTEIVKTSNEMTEVAYNQNPTINKKEWLSNPGACEFCVALNGSVIQLGATFVPLNSTLTGANGGTRMNSYESVEHPPVHPDCRCTLIPVVEG